MRMDADAGFILKTAPHHRTSNHVIGQNDREAVRVPVTPELSAEFRTFTHAFARLISTKIIWTFQQLSFSVAQRIELYGFRH